MVFWLIGLSGVGKSTLATEVIALARKKIPNIALVDGDVVREVWGNDLGYTLEGRRKNAERVCKLCKYLDDQKIHVVCAILSIFHETQKWNRENLSSYFEVFIDTPLNELIKRDSKGLYERALAGATKDVVGIDLHFSPPKNPDLIIQNNGSLEALLSYAPLLVKQLNGG